MTITASVITFKIDMFKLTNSSEIFDFFNAMFYQIRFIIRLFRYFPPFQKVEKICCTLSILVMLGKKKEREREREREERANGKNWGKN